MKRPTKPPTLSGGPGPGPDGPTSGRARKDVNYIPTTPPVPPTTPRSVSPMRAPPPLPSTRTPAADEYDLMEDLATPMRSKGPAPPPAIEPTTGPAAPGSVRSPPVAPPSIRELAAPSSVRDLAQPPSIRDLAAPVGHSGPVSASVPTWDAGIGNVPPTGPMQPIAQPMPPPSSRGAQQVMQQASSGRMRQSTPMDAPFSSGSMPLSQPTGPHVPVAQRPGSAGSDPSYSVGPASSRRPVADEGVPLGYVVASAFFLAIALVGFGLYLAFEVF